MVAGLMFAGLCALATGTATILQARAAGRATTRALGPFAALLAILAQGWYVAGVALDLVGFVASVFALHHLPLFVVQAVVSGSVGVTAGLAAALGVRLGRMEVACLVVLGLGLVLLAVSAASETPHELTGRLPWLLVAAAVPVAVLGLVGLRWPAGHRSGAAAAVLAAAAGLGFTVVAVASRTLVVPPHWWRLATSPTVLAIVLTGCLGMAFFALALQRGTATTVAAISFATETVLPAAIGLLLLGDSPRAGYSVVAASGFVATVAAAIALAKYADVTLPARQPAARLPDGGAA
jgi:drug/metabolite transporter (DMT)-like permease